MQRLSRSKRHLTIALGLALALATGACEAARTDPSRVPVEASPSMPPPMPTSAPSTPTPAPTAAAASDRLRLVVNEADGYQIRVPVAWVDRADRSEAGVRSFGFADMRSHPALSVSVGTDGGRVRVCDEHCDATTVAHSLDQLQWELLSVPIKELVDLPFSEIHSQSQLGGEPARVERVQFPPGYLFGPVAFDRVFAIHAGRPVVLTFDHWSMLLQGEPAGQLIARIVDSFRFLDPNPPAARWQVYHSDAYGFDIQVPADWIADEADGVTFFREDEETKLAVSIGDATGRVSVCTGGCHEVVVSSLDDLDAILPAYDARIGPAPQREVQVTTRLDGFRARLTAPLLDFPLMSIPGWTHAFSANPGRAPIVLRFTVTVGGRVQQQALPTDLQRHIIRSFALES